MREDWNYDKTSYFYEQNICFPVLDKLRNEIGRDFRKYFTRFAHFLIMTKLGLKFGKDDVKFIVCYL